MKFKKNKVIISSLIGLTALTVCGVGFSAWVIGLNQPTITLEGMGVEIDTVTESTQYLNIVAAADEKIVIANPFKENGVGDTVGEGIGTDGTKTCDLDIVLTSYDFAFASDATFNSLTFTPTVNTKPIEGTVLTSDAFGRTAGNLPYITLKSYTDDVSSLSGDFTRSTDVAGYYIYTANNLKLSFEWGSFFGNTDPASFYQAKIKAAKTTEGKLTLMNQARTELKAMDTLFKNDEGYHTINIKAELSVTPAN